MSALLLSIRELLKKTSLFSFVYFLGISSQVEKKKNIHKWQQEGFKESDTHCSSAQSHDCDSESKALLQNKALWANVSPSFGVKRSVVKQRSDIFGKPFCILLGSMGEAVSRGGKSSEQLTVVTSYTMCQWQRKIHLNEREHVWWMGTEE